MSAVDALDTQRAKSSQRPPANLATTDFAWRVLVLLNVFRLSVAAVLLAVFYLVDAPRIIGGTDPTLAWRALIAWLGAGGVLLTLLQRRMPSTLVQTYLAFVVDLVASALLIHSSGGISSGLGGVLIVSVGTLALLLPIERAFLLAAVAALVLLGQQTYAQLQGITTSAQFAPVGILGAVVFVITAVVQWRSRDGGSPIIAAFSTPPARGASCAEAAVGTPSATASSSSAAMSAERFISRHPLQSAWATSERWPAA